MHRTNTNAIKRKLEQEAEHPHKKLKSESDGCMGTTADELEKSAYAERETGKQAARERNKQKKKHWQEMTGADAAKAGGNAAYAFAKAKKKANQLLTENDINPTSSFKGKSPKYIKIYTERYQKIIQDNLRLQTRTLAMHASRLAAIATHPTEQQVTAVSHTSTSRHFFSQGTQAISGNSTASAPGLTRKS